MVKREAVFENGYIGVVINISDVLLCNCDAPW